MHIYLEISSVKVQNIQLLWETHVRTHTLTEVKYATEHLTSSSYPFPHLSLLPCFFPLFPHSSFTVPRFNPPPSPSPPPPPPLCLLLSSSFCLFIPSFSTPSSASQFLIPFVLSDPPPPPPPPPPHKKNPSPCLFVFPLLSKENIHVRAKIVNLMLIGSCMWGSQPKHVFQMRHSAANNRYDLSHKSIVHTPKLETLPPKSVKSGRSKRKKGLQSVHFTPKA